jgi:CheY-like chemotaxis protein
VESDIAVLGCCRTGEEALQTLREHQADVLVLDLRMPGMGRLGVLREMSRQKMTPAVAVYTTGPDAVRQRQRPDLTP